MRLHPGSSDPTRHSEVSGNRRQLLLEHGGTGLLIERPSGPRLLGELLAESFGPGDLP